MDLVPVVDIAHPGATSLDELDRACRHHGFFLLRGHGLDNVIDDTFSAARHFFDTDASVFSALGLSSTAVDGHRGDRTSSHMRLNHYTIDDPVPTDQRGDLNELADDVALGEHTDSGLLTLLIQDAVGGLQALATGGSMSSHGPEPWSSTWPTACRSGRMTDTAPLFIGSSPWTQPTA